MDKVRFGRALGYGARHAAKSLVSAVDAATSPDPNPRRAATVTEHAAQAAQVARKVTAARHEATRQARKSLFAPVKAFSSVVLLQVTGSFFALFAMTMGGAVLKHRAAFRLPISTTEGQRVYFYLAAFLVFAYFAVSNFVRAGRKS